MYASCIRLSHEVYSSENQQLKAGLKLKPPWFKIFGLCYPPHTQKKGLGYISPWYLALQTLILFNYTSIHFAYLGTFELKESKQKIYIQKELKEQLYFPIH